MRTRLDRVAPEVRSTFLPGRARTDQVFHYSIPVLDETGDGRLEPVEEIGSSKTLLRGGEVLISKLNPRKPRVLIAEPHNVPTVCSGEFVVLDPVAIDRRYLYWRLLADDTRQTLEARVQSVTRSQQRASPEDVMTLWFDLPGIDEQVRIAARLDAMAARTDILIARKERHLDLLDERRRQQFAAAVASLTLPRGRIYLGCRPSHPVGHCHGCGTSLTSSTAIRPAATVLTTGAAMCHGRPAAP
jgi:type I restriction enzyme S subunit